MEILQSESAPQLAIIDWMMPDIEGIEICRMPRKSKREIHLHTAADREERRSNWCRE